MSADPHNDWGGADLAGALEAAVFRVRALLGPLPPAGKSHEPKNNPASDLTTGSVVAGVHSGGIRWCRVCELSIHAGRPIVTHWPDAPRSSVAYDYHPSCLPEGSLP